MSGNTLTKVDIITVFYERQNQKRAIVKSTVEMLLRLMKQTINKEGPLILSGFGKFEEFDKKVRKGRNPKNRRKIQIPAAKTVKFTTGKALKDAIQ